MAGSRRRSSAVSAERPSRATFKAAAARSSSASMGTMVATGTKCASTGPATSAVPKPAMPKIT